MKNPLLVAAATLLALGLAHTGSAQGPQGRGRPPATPTITTLAGDVQADTRDQVTRDGGSHPMWLPDGQALDFDRDHQMFGLAVNAKDMSSRTPPLPRARALATAIAGRKGVVLSGCPVARQGVKTDRGGLVGLDRYVHHGGSGQDDGDLDEEQESRQPVTIQDL